MMKITTFLTLFICTVPACLVVIVFFPATLSPLASALHIEAEGFSSIALALLLTTIFSVSLALVIYRNTNRYGLAILNGILIFSLLMLLWPVRIDITKAPQSAGDVDSGFYVYRPFWRGPYLRMERNQVHLENLHKYKNQGSRWFGETTISTSVNTSKGAPYSDQNFPKYENSRWSNDDIDNIRSQSNHYACIARREFSFGPFTRVDIFTPTYHPDAFRKLCTPIS